MHAVFEHLGLTSAGASARKGRLFLLKRHVPQKVFDRSVGQLRVDFFTIHSTFLRDATESRPARLQQRGGEDRVIERRGRVGGVWTYTMARAIEHAGDKFIEEARIGGRMYAELLAEADSSRRTVKRKQRVFVCFVPEVGRDVAHRVIEVLEAGQADALARQNSSRRMRQDRETETMTRAAEAAGAAAPSPAADDATDNVELLSVDVDEGCDYQPPEFLRPFIDHEVLDADERRRYSLRELSKPADRSERTSNDSQ